MCHLRSLMSKRVCVFCTLPLLFYNFPDFLCTSQNWDDYCMYTIKQCERSEMCPQDARVMRIV